MADLEQRLRELARTIEFPETPELAPGVERALGAHRRRRRVAAALALAVLAIGVAFAVPPARSAILDWLGFGPIRIERVAEPPDVPLTRRLDLGAPATLAKATRALGFPVRMPRALGRPDRVYVRGRVEVTLVYRRGGRRLLLAELRGSEPLMAMKVAGRETRVERVAVGGALAVWLSGRPHLFAYLDAQGRFRQGRVRLAGNTLLFQSGPLVLRLEGARSLADALRIAESVAR